MMTISTAEGTAVQPAIPRNPRYAEPAERRDQDRGESTFAPVVSLAPGGSQIESAR